MTMSASAKLTYGNFGTGNYRAGYSAPVVPNSYAHVATGAGQQLQLHTLLAALVRLVHQMLLLYTADLTGETAHDAATGTAAQASGRPDAAMLATLDVKLF